MKINDKLYGFTVKKSTEIAEIDAVLYELEYEKCGASLLYLEREDENKTFSIAFKTIPEDSTGVFHIIEHSVLCGSAKYPVKEPFVELLKSSLQTFLNAMTFPDKTVYPVASRNDKDFLNLMGIYLDAVFCPAILENENIFLQEGWHYEINDETGELTTSGVVLNEMRGAFSSADELSLYHLKDMIYPDNCYRFESGGEPSHVTDLTYEQFRAAHAKYYHPSNSIIFLDGSVNLDEALPLIASYLEGYEKIDLDFDVYDQGPIEPQYREVEYEIAPTDTPENKTRMAIATLTTRFDEQEKAVAANVLFDAIASSNESPLKKAILASGLCEDFSTIPLDSMKENILALDFKNVKDGKCEELIALTNDVLRSLYEEGIDKDALESALNSLEFKVREKDYGRLPRGIVFALAVLESALYGGDAAQNLSYNDTFSSIREKLSGRYFEELLLELLINNTHRATVVMKPSTTLGKERADAEREKLAKIRESFSEEELARVREKTAALKAWQEAPDSQEALATIPLLSVSDVSDKVEFIPRNEGKIDTVTTLSHDIATAGITYADVYFDCSDLTEEELYDAALLFALITNVKTDKHTALELQTQIKRSLGSFSASLRTPLTKDGVKIYTAVSFSTLDSKKSEALELVREILYASDYSDKEVLSSIVKQMKMAEEESMTTAGHALGLNRALAQFSVEAAIEEYHSGYESHLKTKKLVSDFDTEADTAIARISALAKRIFTKERATVSFVGSPDDKFAKELVGSLKSGGEAPCGICKIKLLKKQSEGILIPSQVAYAELGATLDELGEKYKGSYNVARTLVSYGYLWGAVRVQGGAYGVGLSVQPNGSVAYYSYRDPSPVRSIECYKETSEFLRAFAQSGEDITKFIIGAVGSNDPLTTPKTKGAISAVRYLRGITYEDACRTRREILDTDTAELRRIADVLDKIAETATVCVVAGKEKLDECQSASIISTVLEI